VRNQNTNHVAAGRNRACRGQLGFTLVELLTVVLIIIVLVGVGAGVSKLINRKAGIALAKSQIAMMSTALESYKIDWGHYPITGVVRTWYTNVGGVNFDPAAVSNSYVLYRGLAGGPKTYYSIPPSQLRTNYGTGYWVTNSGNSFGTWTSPTALLTIQDPFGHPYNYYCTSPTQTNQINAGSFDLWSYGPDGRTGGTNSADDIANYSR